VLLDSIDRALWLRSRSRPLKLTEIVQAIVVLAYSFAMPMLLMPTMIVLLIVLLDRLGLTLLGKVVVLVALGGTVQLLFFISRNH